jgi:hypothetical protein
VRIVLVSKTKIKPFFGVSEVIDGC